MSIGFSESSPGYQDMDVHPMVYHLPDSTQYHPRTHHHHLVQHSTMSPSQEEVLIPTSMFLSHVEYHDRLPLTQSQHTDKLLTQLPSMNITAPSWWPEK